ncbi:MAG: Tn3 family transposase [Oscillochloridaceae bacterium umkhey_bin13]
MPTATSSFLAYQQVCNGLEAGTIVCRASVQFRSFADDLLSDEQWREKERILAAINLPGLRQPIREQLAALEEQLEACIQEVNARIANGENTDVRVTRRGEHRRWTLSYPPGSEPVNDPLFDSVPQVDLRQVLAFAQAGCEVLSAFSHVLSRYQKQRPEPAVLYACLMAWGTNMGLGRMGEISDLPTHVLMRASENYLRPETLRAANDLVCNAIAALPIARHYDLNGLVHSSSDGQKFETALPTFNARHSRKYFGLRKGIVANTLVAGYIPVNAQVIGAHDHESHYILDLLLNNTTSVQPAIHSTDTYGTNEVNFALLHVFGYQFAPRYRRAASRRRSAPACVAILSRVLEERRAAGDLAGVAQLTQVALIAWQHINFYGRYEFTSRVAPIDLERVVAALLQNTSSGMEHVA